jgi:hypothetical protein
MSPKGGIPLCSPLMHFGAVLREYIPVYGKCGSSDDIQWFPNKFIPKGIFTWAQKQVIRSRSLGDHGVHERA